MLTDLSMKNYNPGKYCLSGIVLVIFCSTVAGIDCKGCDCILMGLGAIIGYGVFRLVTGKNVFSNRAVRIVNGGMLCTASPALDCGCGGCG